MSEAKLKDLIDYVARALVEKPEQIRITDKGNDRSHNFELEVDAEDRGRVIGKNGQTIRALRNLVGAAAALEGKGATVDVTD